MCTEVHINISMHILFFSSKTLEKLYPYVSDSSKQIDSKLSPSSHQTSQNW